jgi:SAM-dependent methyltransferase
MSKNLEFTGERFTPECVREIWYEHVHRYAFARDLVAGLNVLDAACGEGYGSALLSTKAAHVTGVDISAQAIEHASARYPSDSLTFRVSDCLTLPFEAGEFDCIVSFETLEHLEDHDGLMAEFQRVLKPGGFLLISSPDKAIYTDKQKNDNEFHLRELYRDEFEELLLRYFPCYHLLGQKLLFQSAIWALDGVSTVSFQQEHEGQVASFSEPHHHPVYLLAVCALDDTSLPRVESALSLFDDSVESVYEHYYQEIRKHIAAGELLLARDKELAELKNELALRQPGTSWWRRWFGKS